MKYKITVLLVALPMIIFCANNVIAQEDNLTPVGYWITQDDISGKDRSIVKIWHEDGQLTGKIVELIDPPIENPKCEACRGNLRNQPIEGLQIFSGLSKNREVWDGGKILDPESGKEYKVFLKVLDDGTRLKVRGYVGLKSLGRSQFWRRSLRRN